MRVQNRATNAGAYSIVVYRDIYNTQEVSTQRKILLYRYIRVGWEARTQKCACEIGRLTQEAVYIYKYMSHTGGKEWEFFGEGVYWWAGKHERKNNKIFLEKLMKGEYFVSIYRGHR